MQVKFQLKSFGREQSVSLHVPDDMVVDYYKIDMDEGRVDAIAKVEKAGGDFKEHAKPKVSEPESKSESHKAEVNFSGEGNRAETVKNNFNGGVAKETKAAVEAQEKAKEVEVDSEGVADVKPVTEDQEKQMAKNADAVDDGNVSLTEGAPDGPKKVNTVAAKARTRKSGAS